MVLAHDITKGNRTRDVKISQNITFETMMLTPNTMKGLKAAGFYKPSPIQLYGIPIGKCGFDLLLEAKSGTGKTAVFSIIALELLDLQKGLQVVILTPTREIAAQIYDVLKQIGCRYDDLQIAVVMGGLSFQEDVEKFKKPIDIVVGSPGRLRHLIHNKHIDTTAVRLLILDEADKLMEKCFQADIKYIHATLPKQKQVIMSSATYSDVAKSFINNYVQNANHVCPDSDSILLGIKQKVTLVKYNSNIVRHTQDRFKELLQILTKIQFKQCLVFCNYQARVSEVHKLLKKQKWPSEQLYGQQEQVDRLDALKTLQQYKCRILVSTDLAARGIDASNIDLVVNFEPPYEWQTYLHRIGRAGRFGLYGLAITILSEGKEQQKFKDIFKAMELSVNIHYLWSDKKFNGNNSVTLAEQCNSPTDNDTPTEVNHEEMWEMLNSNTNDVNVIESFENLCDSKEKFERPNIENFSDLMLSLENEDCPDREEEYLFKQMDIKNTLDMTRLSRQKSVGPHSRVSDNNEDKFVDDIETNDADEIEQLPLEEFAHTDFDIPKTGENVRKAIIDQAADMKNAESPTMISSTKIKSYNTTTTKTNAMSANIPHGSYIDHVKSNKNDSISKHTNVKKYVKLCNNKLDSNDLNINSHSKIKTNACNGDNFKQPVNYYGGKNYAYAKQHRTCNVTHVCTDSEKQDEHEQIYSKHSRNLIYETEMKQRKYAAWYNQLKMRVKWIEQSIYINEMSKQ